MCIYVYVKMCLGCKQKPCKEISIFPALLDRQLIKCLKEPKMEEGVFQHSLPASTAAVLDVRGVVTISGPLGGVRPPKAENYTGSKQVDSLSEGDTKVK